ncbi:MAG: PKD domain-containing protein [Bacteroidia bacterium]|nr:PKD domain-containing protein [Bacteroidia bacterium]
MKTALSKFNLGWGLIIICLLFGATSLKAQNISFSVDTNSGCVPLSIEITNTSDTAGINFLWIVYEEATEEFDTISTGFEPNLTLTEPGEFMLYVLGYNSSDSLVGSDLEYIWADGTGSSFYQSADTICPGDDIFIAYQGEAWGYSMDFGDGTDTSGTCCMYHTYDFDGIYDITLILESDCGADTLVQEIVVDSNAVPNATIYASGNNACPGDSIYFYSNAEPDDLMDFYWVANNDTIYTETTVFGFADTGSYTVELHLTNTCGNNSISTYDVSISDSNSLMVIYNAPMEICPGQDGYFSADINNPYSSATIYYGDGNSDNFPSNKDGLLHAYADTGTYSTMFIVTNGCGNTDTSYGDVTVKEDTNQYFTAGFYSTGDYTVGTSIDFWPWDYDGELTYIWELGDGDTTYSVYPSMIYNDTGAYIVTLTMVSPCGPVDSYSDTIYITDGQDSCNYPSADMDYYPDSICPGGSVNFESWSWDANYVRWYFGDGTSSTDEYTNHTYANAGTYNIMLVAYGDCGNDTANWAEIYVGNVDPMAYIAHYPDSVCSSDTVYMLDYMVFGDDQPSTSNTYNVDYGDGTVDFTSTLIDEIFIGKHVYGANGTYNVEVTVENECGGIKVFYDTVRVISSAPANADILTWDEDGDTLWVCPGDQIDLLGFGGVVYDWDFGDGTSSTDKNVTVSYLSNGIYTVVLTTTNGCANSATDSLVVNVNSNNVPEVDAWDESGNDICAGNYKSFNSYVGNYDYLMWNFGDGTVSFEDAPTHYFDTPGLYEVILYAYNSCGTGSDTISFEVYEVPVANFDLDTNYVANLSTPVGITNNSVNIVTSYWMFGDGNSSWNDNASLQHTYADSGVYQITLVVWNIEGCSDTTSLSVIIGTDPSTIDLCDSLYVDFESDAFFGIGQAGQQIVFTDYSEDALGSVNSWNWNFGDGNSSSDQNPTHTYSSSGTYTVTLTATTDFGCLDSATATLLIFPSDTSSLCDNTNADFSVSSQTVGIGQMITFTNNSSSDGFILGYFWAFGDDSTSLEKNPTHSYSSAGTYNVTLSMMDLNLCTDTATIMITVDTIAIGIFEEIVNSVTFNVYPNPFTYNTTIEYMLPENIKSSKLIITDITGKIVENIELDPRSNTYHFNGNNYDRGIYSCMLLVDGIPIKYNRLVIMR